MKLMQFIIAIVLVGCSSPPVEPESQIADYGCLVQVEKINGVAKTVTIRFPGGGNIYVSDRPNMDQLIVAIESVLVDLKEVKEQFPIVEPLIEKKFDSIPDTKSE